MKLFTSEINKNFILDRVSQEDIFSKYLGMTIDTKGLFKSPLRKDRNPTCSFNYNSKGMLYMKDWSGYFHGDCFNLVEFLYGCDYRKACEKIASDFNLTGKTTILKKITMPNYEEKVPSKIQVRCRDWNKKDEEYWGAYGISIALLYFYKIAPAKEVWVNGKLVYRNDLKNPAYIYYFGPGEYKVYFPLKKEYRFICNTSVLQGYSQLPETGELCIITKSLKDIAVLHNFDIPAVAPQGESIIPSQKIIDELKLRFKVIYSLYDFDLTGVRSANKMKKQYDVKPKFFTNGRFGTPDYGGKDVSDIYKNKGIETVRKSLQSLEIW